MSAAQCVVGCAVPLCVDWSRYRTMHVVLGQPRPSTCKVHETLWVLSLLWDERQRLALVFSRPIRVLKNESISSHSHVCDSHVIVCCSRGPLSGPADPDRCNSKCEPCMLHRMLGGALLCVFVSICRP